MTRFILLIMMTVTLISPVYADSVTVSTVSDLVNAVNNANSGGPNEILLTDGTYTLGDMLWIAADNVTVRSISGNRNAVTIEGQGGMYGGVSHIFNVAGTNFTARDMTLRGVANHAVQIHGEDNADNPVLQNLVFQDTFEQMVKISYGSAGSVRSDNGLVERCLFEYTAGIGPQYYIGGVDGHFCSGWIIRDNVFRDIQSPESDLAEYAIHFWSDTEDTIVERNLIINCDRGIGFGLGDRGHQGGIIRNNMIYHDADDTNADVGIGLETCTGTQVYNNTIYFDSSYANAIEYRFLATSGVYIANNLSNRAVTARDDATGTIENNFGNASASWFANPSTGDLHLASSVAAVVDAGLPIAGLFDDFDGDPRPYGSGVDIGADEWGANAPVTIDLTLNDSVFTSGQRFLLGWSGNAEGGMVNGDVYLLLDVAGSYWFWPSWTQMTDFETVTLTDSPTELTILDFTWPNVAFSNVTIRFWSAMTRPGTLHLISNVAGADCTI